MKQSAYELLVSSIKDSRLGSTLRRSEGILGLNALIRGLGNDIGVMAKLVRRGAVIDHYLKTHSVTKLQLGTSNNVLSGWLNTDVAPNHRSVVYLDVTKAFPLSDNTFDYVFSEHMIEHVSHSDGQMMLQECFRVLRPGGTVRVATPDLKVLLSLYDKEKTAFQKRYIDWSVKRFMPEVPERQDVFVINNFFRAWGHRFLYDGETLHGSLARAGFRDITFHAPGQSDYPELRKIECHGRELGSDEINDFETIVIEGRKA